MSKIIKLSKEHIEKARAEFEEYISSARVVDGKVSFTRDFSEEKNAVADIYFTTRAWSKMLMILENFDKEVAWHGFAERMGDEADNDYLISDIVVYPQKVTGTTVSMDEEEYGKWIDEHVWDDPRYLRFGMQGHSHVRMGTTPSPTDIKHQQDIIDRLDPEGFYIFMIYNKYLAHTIRIFDMKKNILFEDKDIHTWLYDEGDNLEEFIADAKSMVRESTVYAPKSTYGGTGSAGAAKTAAAAGKTQSLAVVTKKETPKGSENAKPVMGSGWKGAKNVNYIYDQDEDDDSFYDGYYGGYGYGGYGGYGYEEYIDADGIHRYRPKY